VIRALLRALAGCLALAAAAGVHAAESKSVQQAQLDLTVRIDPATRAFAAQAVLSCRCSGTLDVSLGGRFAVESVSVDDAPHQAKAERTEDHRRLGIVLPATPAQHRISLRYAGTLAVLVEADERGVLGGLPPMTSERGTYLPAGSGWYPEVDVGTFTYRIAIEMPAGQRALVPGRLVSEATDGPAYRAQFALDDPAQGIELVAGPYRVEERRGDVWVRTYFHPEIADLSAGYLDAAAGYVARYAKSIGPYPYAGFSIASSPLPTGFGMPAFTYLGIDVLKLPFIRSTSLGHEVLHNWWGNGVYVDWQRGNWSEGLTTFMADYAYKEDEGEAAAREMRLGWLRDFAAVPPGRDRPLREFTSRTHDASQIVGYNKAAFVFYMLRDEISADTFAASLRRFYAEKKFQAASWADLEHAFSAQSGQNLQPFFAQWLERTGAPRLHVDDARAEQAGNGWRIRLTLSQGEPAYRLRVPLEVQTERGAEQHVVRIDRARQDLVIETQAQPKTLSVDPGLRVFRRLDASEIPAILRQVTLDPAAVTVIVSRTPEVQTAAPALAQRLMDTGPRFADAVPPRGAGIVMGLHEDIDAWLAKSGLPPEPVSLRGRGTAQVWTAALADGRTVLIVSARDAASLQSLARPLPHYGRQSWLVFEGAKAIDRGVWEVKAVSWRFE
jgi:hypothetical protein